MSEDEVAILARALGGLEAEMKGFRLDWDKERRQICGKFDRIFATLTAMEERHAKDDRREGEDRVRLELLAQQQARRKGQLGVALVVLNHGVVRALLAAGAAGAGFGVIAQVFR